MDTSKRWYRLGLFIELLFGEFSVSFLTFFVLSLFFPILFPSFPIFGLAFTGFVPGFPGFEFELIELLAPKGVSIGRFGCDQWACIFVCLDHDLSQIFDFWFKTISWIKPIFFPICLFWVPEGFSVITSTFSNRSFKTFFSWIRHLIPR